MPNWSASSNRLILARWRWYDRLGEERLEGAGPGEVFVRADLVVKVAVRGGAEHEVEAVGREVAVEGPRTSRRG